MSLAQPRPRLLEPGLPTLPPGVERYRVGGGGAVVVAVSAGDTLTIVDKEGRQRAELAVFAPDGRPDPGAIGAKATGPAAGISRLLSGDDEDAAMMAAALARRGLPGRIERAIALFEHDSAPGEEVRLAAERDGIVILHAVGGPMVPEEQTPATDLILFIRRARLPERSEPVLPPPLAEPRHEFRIERASALAYEIAEGEYIQIIDIEGRQCSDFLAFNARQLQRGVERGLEVTTTRTLNAMAYPGPGLYAKFFDQDMQPLVEVVRDTVGRHDAFALACTAKYYEDMGYPGHRNCSDNFNGALQPYGVAARRGWPAINYFYNTILGADNILTLDEPWSRPGDYVLMRAATDLVCASSACPDDIDPANGWNPTEIHVRIYPKTRTFSRAIATRMTPDADAELTRETGFHPRTSRLTRAYTAYRGFWLPQSFAAEGPIEEYWACRERAAVIDLSALRKFEVLGPDAEALMQHCVTRDVRRLAVGQVVYTALCYEHGGMIDDGTLFRLGPDNFRWICGEAYGGEWLRQQAAKKGWKVWVKSATDQLHNIAVQGPKSREILKEIIWTPPARPSLAELGWFRFTVGRIGDHNGTPVVVSRTGYTGELGYEIWCHPKDAATVWDRVFEAGAAHGIAPMGLLALDMLRIEAGLVFAGYEFTDEIDPFEAGIGFTVPAKKDEEFIGKAALERRRAHPQRALVGLELAGNETVGHGDCVHIGRARIGTITSGTRSPVLKKSIALARLDIAHAAPGTEVEVGKLDGHQKRLPAVVVPFPFYDPGKTRVRS
ncbi:MAG: aminomethyltransferase family protein [Rhodospirillales bacterium]|nr:aminomethyltransferase family protein [Rhodospirillales bacterium]